MKTRLLTALCALAIPAIAEADVTPVEADRIVVQGGMNAGGSTTVSADTGIATVSPSYDGLTGGIAGIQYDHVIADYFVLGGRFGVTRYDISDYNDLHRTWLDFDVVPTFTLAIDAGPIVLEPRVSVPVGVGMHLWNAKDDLLVLDDIRRTNFAWNVGALGGALVRPNRGSDFVRRLGVSLELGFMHHNAYATGRINDWHYKLSQNQFVMQVGLAVSLP